MTSTKPMHPKSIKTHWEIADANRAACLKQEEIILAKLTTAKGELKKFERYYPEGQAPADCIKSDEAWTKARDNVYQLEIDYDNARIETTKAKVVYSKLGDRVRNFKSAIQVSKIPLNCNTGKLVKTFDSKVS